MKKITLLFILVLTLTFIKGQSTACDSLTITGSQYQLQITANNLNTFVYYWETMGSDGTILEQDSSMSTTHNVYNFNMSTGQNYDTLITCISTMNTFCCVTLVWDGNNWMNASGFNPPPPPPPSVGTCGNFTLELYDSFGDGWNGASLDIIINGALFHSVTLATGIGPEIFTFVTDSNDVIDLIYNAGSWDDENTYNLIDNSGNLIISQGAFGFVPNLSPVSSFGIFACSNSSPLNCNANFYWWQDFDSINNNFTNDVYCVENSSGGIGPFSYNWVFGDGNSSNLQYPTHVYNQVGDYNLCLTYTDANGCSSNYCDTITISSRNGYTLNVIDESQIATLSLEKMEIISGIKIFPNPINNQSYIEINTNQNLETFITYLDCTGKVIKSEKINLFKGLNRLPINSQELNSGIYFFNISNNDQKLNKTIKFIK